MIVFALGCGDARQAGGALEDGGAVGQPDVHEAQTQITVTSYLESVHENLTWVAWQDGDELFVPIEGAQGTYRFVVTRERFGVAWRCDAAPNGNEIRIVYLTVEEAAAIDIGCSIYAGALSVSGTITGAEATDTKVVSLLSDSSVVNAETDSYLLSNVKIGTHDLVATRGSAGSFKTEIVLHRDIAVTADLVRDIDFDTDGVELTSHGWQANSAEVLFSRLYTHHGSVASLGSSDGEYRAVPPSALRGNDVVMVEASRRFDDPGDTSVHAVAHFKTAADLVLELPAPFDSPVVSVPVTTPHVRPQVEFEPWPEATLYAFHAAGGSPRVVIRVELSAAWLGGAASYVFPDLSASGWDPAWAIPIGGELGWHMEVKASTAGAAELLRRWPRWYQPRPSWDGLEYAASVTQGMLSP